MELKRSFEGIFISNQVRSQKSLTSTEKFLLAVIKRLCSSRKHCLETNAFFTKNLGVSLSTVKRGLRKLQKLNLIIITYDLKERRIVINLNQLGEIQKKEADRSASLQKNAHTTIRKKDEHYANYSR